MSKKSRNSKIVIDTLTGIYYDSITEASLTTKYSIKHFSRMLSGKYKNTTNLILTN